MIEKLNFSKITLVVNDLSLPKTILNKKIEIIKGGKYRTISVKNALLKSKYKAKNVIIHDCARLVCSHKLINKIANLITKGNYDCIVPYSNCSDTILDKDKYLDRKKIKLIKTPQAFKKSKLLKLHKLNKNPKLTDDSQLFTEKFKKFEVKFILDRYINLKITYKEDLESLNYLDYKDFRTGLGYDIHRIIKVTNKQYITLGGIKILSKAKIISHSDGDVILHAITDSILGALSLRDIGTYFPNNKKNFRRNSKDFLNFALERMRKMKFLIGNIDLMIVSERPKINPYYDKMIKELCSLLNITENSITIKATTNEKSGLIGDEKFIACWSSLSLIKN